MSEYSDSEQPLIKEHAYNVSEKREARRKLNKARTIVIGALAAVGGLVLGGEALQQQPVPVEIPRTTTQQSEATNEKADKYAPDSYYTGKVNITKSENLNVRTSPRTDIDTNILPNWGVIKEIRDETKSEDIQGHEGFSISKPLIIKEDDPTGSEWIVLKAKVDNGLGPQDQRLYIKFSSDTKDYVKPIESGSFIDLQGYSLAPDLGQIEIGSK